MIKTKKAQRSVVSVFFWILVIILIAGIGFYTSNLAKITGFAVKGTTATESVISCDRLGSACTVKEAEERLTGLAAAQSKGSSYYESLPDEVKKDPNILKQVVDAEELLKNTGWDCNTLKKGYCTKPKNRNIQVALKTATQATQPAPKTETPTYAFTDGVTIPKSLFDESGLTLGAYVKSKNLVTISGNKYTVTKDSATQTFIYSGKDYVRIMGNDIYVNDNKITSASAELRKYVADGRLDITGLKSVTPPQNTNKLELKFADKTTTTLDGEKNTIITVTGEKTETLFVVGEKKMVVALGRTSYFDSTGKPLSKPEFEKRGEVSLTDSGGIKTGEIGGKEIFILSNEKIFEN